jgi:hypothetical protein
MEFLCGPGGMKCQSIRCSSSNANVAFARWSADRELRNASAAVLIIEAEYKLLPEGASGCFIASTGDSNKETPAMPSVDCRNSRLPSVLFSFDGLVIRRPSPSAHGVSVALVVFPCGAFINQSALRG